MREDENKRKKSTQSLQWYVCTFQPFFLHICDCRFFFCSIVICYFYYNFLSLFLQRLFEQSENQRNCRIDMGEKWKKIRVLRVDNKCHFISNHPWCWYILQSEWYGTFSIQTRQFLHWKIKVNLFKCHCIQRGRGRKWMQWGSIWYGPIYQNSLFRMKIYKRT